MESLPSHEEIINLIETSVPEKLNSAQDAIAIFVHACMLKAGFALVGLQNELKSPISAEEIQALPSTWNKNHNYIFRYSHHKLTDSDDYIVLSHPTLQITRNGDTAISITAEDANEGTKASLEIKIADFANKYFFPYPRDDSEPLQDGFHGQQGVDAFIRRINDFIKNILRSEEQGTSRLREGEAHRAPPQSNNQKQESQSDTDPLRLPSQFFNPPSIHNPRPMPDPMPTFANEYEIPQPHRPGNLGNPYAGTGRHPLSIGADDLNPLGQAPDPLFIGGGRGLGGGMHPDRDFFGGGVGGIRGEGYGQAPYGARYDPVGPGEVPGGDGQGPWGPGGFGAPGGPGRGGRGGRGGPGGPGGFGGMGGAPFNPFSRYGSGDFM
ncbi:hypothetical protein BZA77DRAFT_391706 [Pyronema omphalodes]|nr:hypothetical protein BZA77DRAFT_391706 [Pyronema omphalodes]